MPVVNYPPIKHRLTPEENAIAQRQHKGRPQSEIDKHIIHTDIKQVLNYCGLYRISPDLAPILQRLNKALWYVFSCKQWKDGQVILKTGYYTGTGPQSRRVDITKKIEDACVLAGFKTEFMIDRKAAPKGGVKGNRLIIKQQ